MSDNEPVRGRHAAPARPAGARGASPTPPGARPAGQSAPTQAMPRVEQPHASGQTFYAQGAYPSGGAPVRPVDAGQLRQAHPRRSPGKVLGIVAACVVAVLAIAYVGVALYFGSHFFPNSKIGSMDVSLMSSADAERLLSDKVGGYELEVSGQGFDLTLSAADAGVTFDAASVVSDALSQANHWAWPLELSREHDATASMVTSYNDSGLEQAVRTAVEQFNAQETLPQNASIAYNPATDAYEIGKEQVGTALDPEAVVRAADAAVADLTPKVTLSASDLLQPTVLSTDERLKNAVTAANTMISADLVLAMGGSTIGEVGPDLLSQWIVLGDDLSATLDDAALSAWVSQLAASSSTVGSSRTYTRADGKTITVSGGVYGWQVDTDSLIAMVRDGVAAGQKATLDVPTTQAGAVYNGVGQRDWGTRYLDIDLAEQHVRLYDESGAVVWESDCISGIPDGTHDTSVGVYYINQKASPSQLIGYENGEKIYESTVQYWMPFDGNVIGLHDAPWQPGFGGTMYKDGYGSHGCVNLPSSKAQELYGLIQSGDTVVSHW